MLLNKNNLTKGSIIRVNIICDYCGDIFSQEWRSRIRGHTIIEKDSCKKCSTKKRKESCMKKYGVEIASQSNEAKVKQSKKSFKGGKGCSLLPRRKEILELYNNNLDISINKMSKKLKVNRSVLITFLKSQNIDTTGDIQKKRESTYIQRYGSKNPYDNKEYKDTTQAKSEKTCEEKYGFKNIIQHPDRQEELEKKRESYRQKTRDKKYNGKSITNLADKLNIANSTLYQRIQKWGIKLATDTDKKHSALELFMKGWLDENDISHIHQFKTNPYVADFLVDNIIIECDGLYWHSEKYKDNKYHQDKRQHYIDNGYIPLFFREDEIRDNFPIVCSIILNKLNKSKKYYARKLSIEPLNTIPANIFFNENHLMGKGRGQTFCLTDDGEIICALRICRKKDQIYEVSRFCSKLNCSVIGGFSRLIKHVEKTLSPTEIFTFIDQRYGRGEYLKDLGFIRKASHISFKWTDCINTFHRMKFPGNTGYDENLLKIWDCGQAKFAK